MEHVNQSKNILLYYKKMPFNSNASAPWQACSGIQSLSITAHLQNLPFLGFFPFLLLSPTTSARTTSLTTPSPQLSGLPKRPTSQERRLLNFDSQNIVTGLPWNTPSQDCKNNTYRRFQESSTKINMGALA